MRFNDGAVPFRSPQPLLSPEPATLRRLRCRVLPRLAAESAEHAVDPPETAPIGETTSWIPRNHRRPRQPSLNPAATARFLSKTARCHLESARISGTRRDSAGNAAIPRGAVLYPAVTRRAPGTTGRIRRNRRVSREIRTLSSRSSLEPATTPWIPRFRLLPSRDAPIRVDPRRCPPTT